MNQNHKIKKRKRKSISKKNKLNIINKDNYLYYIFFILLVVVVILGVLVYKAKQKDYMTHADLSIPLYLENHVDELDIDLKELVKKGKYSIKLRNYKGGDINKYELSYQILVENNSKCNIIVNKDDDDHNLMADNKLTRIEDVSLKATEKDEVIYHFVVDDNKGVKNGDKLHIEIKSLEKK